MDKPKGLVSVVVGKLKKQNGDDSATPPWKSADANAPDSEPDAGGNDNAMGCEAAAEGMMRAFEQKDVSALAETLKSFLDCYRGGSDEE